MTTVIAGRDLLRADIAAHAFAIGASAGPPRVGIEAEMIPLLESGRVLPIESADGPSALGLLRPIASLLGWREERNEKGATCFIVPGRAVVSFEPGGQLEIATCACEGVSTAVATLRVVLAPIRAGAAHAGVRLWFGGIDPYTPPAEAPLQLASPRYRAMAAYFEATSPPWVGAAMMRQTAALQINVDAAGAPVQRWRLLNALAPVCTAMFAASPVHGGVETGLASARAAVWRALDPRRTGVLEAGDDPVGEYVEFALDAPMMFCRDRDDDYESARERLRRGELTNDEWRVHLSTLFPEVRPKGYFELRSIDALPPEWYAAPLALVGGVVYDERARREALELVGAPDRALLSRAGITGVADPALRRLSLDAMELALGGCRRLGPGFITDADLELAEAYVARYLRVGRTPADELRGLGATADVAAPIASTIAFGLEATGGETTAA